MDDVCLLKTLDGAEGDIDEILAYHILEHLPRPWAKITPNAGDAMKRWCHLLRVGGVLVVECPDFAEAARRYAITGDERAKRMIFGLARTKEDTHQWGYTLTELTGFMRYAGLDIQAATRTGQSRTALRGDPCIRVVGVKK